MRCASSSRDGGIVDYFIDFTYEAMNYSLIVPIDTAAQQYFIYKRYYLPGENQAHI